MLLSTQPALAAPKTDSPAVTAESPSPATPSETPVSSIHRHDGFYIRLASGISAYDARLRSDVLDGRLTGVATASDIAVGGTIATGFVLAFGVCHASLLVSEFEPEQDASREPPARAIDANDTSLTLFGPFVDYYFRPGNGLHVQGSVGFATLTGFSYDAGGFGEADVAIGGGFMVGLGYELWVADQWSLGAVTRLVTALTHDTDPAGMDWLHGVATLPNVLFSATYH